MPKSKRYNPSTWLDKAVPIVLVFLLILLVGTLVMVGLTALGVFQTPASF